MKRVFVRVTTRQGNVLAVRDEFADSPETIIAETMESAAKSIDRHAIELPYEMGSGGFLEVEYRVL